MFAKVDAYLRDGTAAALGLLAAGLLFWAGALLLIQCTTWVKTGIWQPVPVFAVLLSPEAQTVNLRLTDGIPTSKPRSLISFVSHLTPLDLVPSCAAFDSLDAVAARAAWNMVGLARVLRSLLDTALGFWLVALAFACGWAMNVLEDSDTTSGTIAGRLTPSQAFLASTFDTRFTLAGVLTITCIAGSTALLDWLDVPSGALWWNVVFGVDALIAVGIWFALRSIALHYMLRGGRSLTPRE